MGEREREKIERSRGRAERETDIERASEKERGNDVRNRVAPGKEVNVSSKVLGVSLGSKVLGVRAQCVLGGELRYM